MSINVCLVFFIKPNFCCKLSNASHQYHKYLFLTNENKMQNNYFKLNGSIFKFFFIAHAVRLNQYLGTPMS